MVVSAGDVDSGSNLNSDSGVRGKVPVNGLTVHIPRECYEMYGGPEDDVEVVNKRDEGVCGRGL